MVYSLDTNIISYYLNDKFGVRDILYSKLEGQNEIVLNSISYYETLRGLLKNESRKKIMIFNNLCKELTYQNFIKEDWYASSELYAQCMNSGHPMEDNDLFQAAFCLHNNYTLVTHNIRHFEHLPRLVVVDWTIGNEE